jgi:4'-phosphopantetheinyl transferase
MTACEVWWAAPGDARAGLEHLLDDDERARVRALQRPDDRARATVAAALLRVAAGAWLDCAPAAVRVRRDCPRCGRPHGRPRLPGSGLEASISHAGGRVCVALADGAPVGVDVEPARELDVAGLAGVALDAREAAAVRALAPAERAHGFLVLWTRKEALLKALGCGLTVSPAEVGVSGPRQSPRLEHWPPSAGPPRPATLRALDAGRGHVATLALLAPALQVRTRDGARPLLDAGARTSRAC